jgi:hypothetical protein
LVHLVGFIIRNGHSLFRRGSLNAQSGVAVRVSVHCALIFL